MSYKKLVSSAGILLLHCLIRPPIIGPWRVPKDPAKQIAPLFALFLDKVKIPTNPRESRILVAAGIRGRDKIQCDFYRQYSHMATPMWKGASLVAKT